MGVTALPTSYYNDVIIGGTGSSNLLGNIIINGNLTINSGITFSAINTIPTPVSYNINIKGNWTNNSGTFTAGTGTVTFDGASAQNITGATTFNNITLNNTPAGVIVAPGTNLTVKGNWTNSGAFNAGTASTVTFSGASVQSITGATTFNNITLSNTPNGVIVASSTDITVTGNWIDTGFFNSGLGTNKIIFNNTSIPQTITSTLGVGFNILQINSGSQVTLATNSNSYMSKQIINDGIFNGGSGTSSVFFTNLGSSISGTGVTTFNNLEITVTASMSSSTTFNIKGNFNNGAGFSNFTNTGTVTFNGVGAQTIIGATIFNNLTIANTATVVANRTLTLNSSITVSNTLTFSSGRIVLGANNLTYNGTTPTVGSPNSYVDTSTGTGSFIVGGGVTNSLFPVGNSTTYFPVMLITTVAGAKVRFGVGTGAGTTVPNSGIGSWFVFNGNDTSNKNFTIPNAILGATLGFYNGSTWFSYPLANVSGVGSTPATYTLSSTSFGGVEQQIAIFAPVVVTFYSIVTTGPWNSPATWSNAPTGAAITALPTTGTNTFIIQNNHTINVNNTADKC